MRFPLSAALALSGALSLASCSSNPASPPSADGGPSLADASVPDGGGTVSDAGSSPDAAAVDAGPQCLSVGVTADQCRACCENAYPAGYQSFSQLTVACACQTQYCGPLDGGTTDSGSSDAGDAGSADASDDAGSASSSSWDGGYGQGICSPGTCSYTEQPTADCNTCIYSTLGEVNSLGPCGSPILANCINDTDCWTFFGCVENCPPE